MTFDIKAALHFVVVAECLSFTKAAERLGIAQPWLSQRIRGLEAQLGFTLFERSTRRIELTDKGAAFLAVARPIAAAVTAADHVARVLAREAGGRLRIGAPPYSTRIPIRTKIVSGFIAAHPEVALEIDVGWTPVLLDRVLTGGLDGMFGIGWFEGAGLAVLALGALALDLLLPTGDPLAAGSGPLAAAELAGRRVGVFPRGLYPDLFDRVFGPLAAAGAQLIADPAFFDRPMETAPGGEADIVTRLALPGAGPVAGRRSRQLSGCPDVPFVFLARAGYRLPALDAFRQVAERIRLSAATTDESPDRSRSWPRS